MDEILRIDADGHAVAGAVTNDGSRYIRNLLVDPSTGRLLVDAAVTIDSTYDYAEDAAHSDGAVGAFVLGVRRDADTTPVTSDGDYHALIFDNAGNLKVNVKASGTLTVASHAVTNAGVFAVQVDGAALTALQLIDNIVNTEDNASQSGDSGVVGLAKRLDTPVTNANVGSDADYLPLITDNLGKLWTAQTQTEDAAHASGDRGAFVLGVSNEANTARAADGDYIAFATDTEGNTRIVGNRDHDAVDAGETVKVGYFAVATNANRVAASDRTHGIADLAGRQIVNLGHVREMRGKQTTTITSSTSETTIVTAAASTFKDLVALIISNTSATAVRLDIRDATAGTILFSIQVPAGDVRGFALPGCAIPQTASNNNWTATSSASVADLRILAVFENNT